MNWYSCIKSAQIWNTNNGKGFLSDLISFYKTGSIKDTTKIHDLNSIVIKDDISDMMTFKELWHQGQLENGLYTIGDEIFELQDGNIKLVDNVIADFQYGTGDWNFKFKEQSPIPPKEILQQLKNTTIIDPKTGYPLLMYHGTDSIFDKFDITHDGRRFVGIGNVVPGFYFAPKYDDARGYSTMDGGGELVLEAWLNIINPISRKGLGDLFASEDWNKNKIQNKEDVLKGLKQYGYDGYVWKNNFGQIIEAVAFDDSQIFRRGYTPNSYRGQKSELV